VDATKKNIVKEVSIPFRYSFGHFQSRLFSEMRDFKKIWGTRCPSCGGVLVPPQGFCGQCHVKTGEWVEVSDLGILKGFGVVHIPFEGQVTNPPYVYAEIQLIGSNTTMIHILGEVDMTKVFDLVKVGVKVQAVWKEEGRTGSLQDIKYFRLIS